MGADGILIHNREIRFVAPRAGGFTVGCHALGKWSRGLWLVACFFLTGVCGQASEKLGGLRGSVFDADTLVPLESAQVSVSEAMVSVRTTSEGMFSFGALRPGRYTVSISKSGYVRKIVPDVVVVGGQFTELRVELAPEVFEMEELVVRGFDFASNTEVGLLQIRAESLNISDAIGSDMMSRAGAGTAAAALRLVVGTTVQEGKYVVIRGLSDRYTVTLLNDTRLPTADAARRAVQLDQYPAALIDNIVVKKTFTPDQQGDATGGSVNIQTKHVPEKRVVAVSGSVEYNTETTGRSNFLTYRGGGVTPFAIDDGGRKLPFDSGGLMGFPFSTIFPIPVHNQAQLLDAQAKSFSPVMSTSTKTVGPNYSFGATVGDSREIGPQGKGGLLVGYSYRQKYQTISNGKRNIVTGSVGGVPIIVRPGGAYREHRSTDEVLWGALLMLGYKPVPDHGFSLLLNHNQTGIDEARIIQGGIPGFTRETGEVLKYQERGVSTVQLHGTHQLPGVNDISFDWVAGYNQATQDEPDFRAFRSIQFTSTGVQTLPGDVFARPRRIFREIAEGGPQVRGDLAVPIPSWTDRDGLLKLGAFLEMIDRDFETHTFIYRTGIGALDSYKGPGRFSEIFLGADRVGLGTNSPPGSTNIGIYPEKPGGVDVNYLGEQRILAGYAMAELPIMSQLKLLGGARWEATFLKIDVLTDFITIAQILPNGETSFKQVTGAEAGTEIDQLDLLPMVGLVYEPIPNLLFRLNYAQTIARPTFRELAPVRSFDFIGGEIFLGRNDLTISHIDNYDFRVEWFPRPGDVLAASLFYKEIADPIEQITFSISGGDRYTQRVNYPNGYLYGVEGELRQGLEIIHEALRGFTVGFNASYIFSSVTLPPDEQARLRQYNVKTKKRPLFGQPNYLLNANLTYDNERSGTSVGLFYTLTGKVLVSGQAVTDVFIPDLFEAPVDNLDLSISQKLGKIWTLTFRARNLTDPVFRRVHEVGWRSPSLDETSFRRGREFSLGLSCKW